MTVSSEVSGAYLELIDKLLTGQPGSQQVWFEASVLDKYLKADAYQVLRTDSAGRLRRGRAWAVDFGIAERDKGGSPLLHLSAENLANRLPAAEGDHWLSHLIALPTSTNFLRMQLHPEACIDDGDIRRWGEG